MDKKQIEFHIESGDYFGTLATVLDLVPQALEAKQKGPKQAWYMQSLKKCKRRSDVPAGRIQNSQKTKYR